MAFCTQCGSRLSDEDIFCGACGKRVTSSPAPNQSVQQEIPRFTSTSSNAQNYTTSSNDVPHFTPPSGNAQNFTQPSNNIPQFTPPSNDIPQFNPPAAPIFTPPAQQTPSGPVCYYHPDEEAVATCASCGKYICEDCFETYGVLIGEYAGHALCYECTQATVASNVEELKKNKDSIIKIFALTLIGMVIGAVFFGAQAGVGGVIFGAAIGGCFWTFVKGLFLRMKAAVKASSKASGGATEGIMMGVAVGFIVGFIVEATFSIYRTVRKVIECIYYLRRTSKFIESDSAALQQMKDYMEYTLIRSQNKGVDLETLMGQGSALYDNSYAQAVAANGEASADAMLRRSVTTIAENGEIIRSFVA